MSFKSKRLRVQIPCHDESKVELPTRTIRGCANFNSIPPTFCYFPSEPECVFQSRPITCVRYGSGCPHGSNCGTPTDVFCLPGTRPPCRTGTGPICPGGSEIEVDPPKWIEIEPDPVNPGAVLIRPEDLPRLREHLKSELEGAEQLQEEVRGQLEELDSIEDKLGESEG
jgi:hypothetical protein